MTGKLCCRNERAEEQSLFRRCPSLLSLTLMSVLLLPLSLQAADTGEVNKAANVAAHAVVNAALAVAQGNNALAGAAGAATGEVV